MTHTHGGSGAENRTASAEAWYRSLVEKVPAVLYVDESDEASSAVYMSPQSEALFGYSREEWLEDPELWVKMLHSEDREWVLALHDRARKSGGTFEAEYRLIARDGSVVWVRDEAAPVADSNGGPGKRAGILLDITERKLYEEKLRRSEERHRELFENAMEGIARIFPEGGVIEHCNPAYARVLGLTPEECSGLSFFEFVDGEDEEEAWRQRELRLSGVGSEYKVTITAADGERRVLSCGGYPLFGPDSSYEGAVQTVADVTDRKRHERELEKSEERFRLVAKATGEAIWDNDLTTGVQAWDGATEALFGYPPHQATTGVWWEERIHPQDKERVLLGLAAVTGGDGETWEEGYRFRRADGTYAHVTDRGHVVRDACGRPVRMVGTMRDVSEKRRHQEELRRSEELFRTTFEAAAVGMAHVAPDGRWLRINDALCEISGYRCEELLGMSYRDLTLPEDLADGDERVRRLLAGETGPYTVERRYVRKDGRIVWVSLSVSVVWGTWGEPKYLVCVAKDITKRKLREIAHGLLTCRGREIMALVLCNRSNFDMAETLRLSLPTIKTHIRNILRKLGARNRSELLWRYPPE